jgi:DNA-binding NarL/FixJ family response regulator
MEKCNLFLVDDHSLVRAGIKTLVTQLNNFMVVGEASGFSEAVSNLLAVRPMIVLTDITLQDKCGLELLKWMKATMPEAKAVVLTMHNSEEIVGEAFRLGAAGYLLKEAAPADLDIALRTVMRGERYINRGLSWDQGRNVRKQELVDDSSLSTLTPRQIQILTMIADRKCTKEIAYELGLSEKTIAAHRAQIMERTGVRDVVGLVLFALKHKLINLPH